MKNWGKLCSKISIITFSMIYTFFINILGLTDTCKLAFSINNHETGWNIWGKGQLFPSIGWELAQNCDSWERENSWWNSMNLPHSAWEQISDQISVNWNPDKTRQFTELKGRNRISGPLKQLQRNNRAVELRWGQKSM